MASSNKTAFTQVEMMPDPLTFTLSRSPPSSLPAWRRAGRKIFHVLRTYCHFVGPGMMISVAYIDPGNYAADVAAGASYRFKLLFIVFLSNIFAIYLQALCIHLGTVTGMDLATMLRVHCPRWLNYVVYVFGEAAIIATDIAEVIGTAIALKLLSNDKIPLLAGCAISIIDVVFILIFYRQHGTATLATRVFEYMIAGLVLGVLICFAIQLSHLHDTTTGEVFKGFLPSSELIQGQAIYQACSILGATVMPHSLYLGSGLVQGRLRQFDEQNNLLRPAAEDDEDSAPGDKIYEPSLRAIRSCIGYAIAECTISLLTCAFFINSAILIVAGASLYGIPGSANAGLPGIYHLLSNTLGASVGKLFAAALLLSGFSAGIICTIAGQMVCEGHIRWKIKPWQRRLLTRLLSILPSMVVAGSLGEKGINQALVGSQVALSVILPVISE